MAGRGGNILGGGVNELLHHLAIGDAVNRQHGKAGPEQLGVVSP